LLVRRIRELLYEQGFTISGARNRLDSRLGSGAQEQQEMRIDPASLREELNGILALLQR